MSDVHRRTARPLRAEWLHLADQIDEEPQPRRQLATAGIVEVEAGSQGSPSRHHDSKLAAGDRRSDTRLREIGEAASGRRERQGELRVVERHRAGNVDRDGLVRPLELPPVKALVAEADS